MTRINVKCHSVYCARDDACASSDESSRRPRLALMTRALVRYCLPDWQLIIVKCVNAVNLSDTLYFSLSLDLV
jgi:hypothetical protein